jgi:hypothetical protein
VRAWSPPAYALPTSDDQALCGGRCSRRIAVPPDAGALWLPNGVADGSSAHGNPIRNPALATETLGMTFATKIASTRVVSIPSATVVTPSLTRIISPQTSDKVDGNVRCRVVLAVSAAASLAHHEPSSRERSAVAAGPCERGRMAGAAQAVVHTGGETREYPLTTTSRAARN